MPRIFSPSEHYIFVKNNSFRGKKNLFFNVIILGLQDDLNINQIYDCQEEMKILQWFATVVCMRTDLGIQLCSLIVVGN